MIGLHANSSHHLKTLASRRLRVPLLLSIAFHVGALALLLLSTRPLQTRTASVHRPALTWVAIAHALPIVAPESAGIPPQSGPLRPPTDSSTSQPSQAPMPDIRSSSPEAPTIHAALGTIPPTRTPTDAGFDSIVIERDTPVIVKAPPVAFDDPTDGLREATSKANRNAVDPVGFDAPHYVGPRALSPAGLGGAPGFDLPEAGALPTTRGALAARVPPPEARRVVEVTYKPTPKFTDEARRLRITGRVVLDVVFSAEGHVRVLRVVRSLGHGLDHEAILAAEQIRFRPATTNGQPVDVRTNIEITFELT